MAVLPFALSALPWPAALIDRAGLTIVEVNDALHKLYGGRELAGRSLLGLLGDEPRVRAWIEGSVGGGNGGVGRPLRVTIEAGAGKRGCQFFLEPCGAGLLLVAHGAAGHEGLGEQGPTAAELLEEERRAREEAERLNRLKDEFLATISHELRTPLQAILGWARLLREVGSLPAPLDRGIDAIARNAQTQARLVDDILDVSRMIAGKLRITFRTVDVRATLIDAFETISAAAAAKGVRLENRLEDDVGTVVGDADRLRQIIWNLLANAVKFTPPGGAVVLSAGLRDGRLRVVVADTGQGISPDFLPHVFERFRQADGGTTRAHGGLGLGLAIVKHLVEAHGGSVEAHSRGPGQGSTFTVSLPARAVCADDEFLERPSRPSVTMAHSGEILKVQLTGLRVLLVDDEPDARHLASVVLESRGAVVVEASSVAEAWEWLQAEPFDAVVSDVGMPHEDGYALVRRIRASARLSSLSVLALSAYASEADRRRAMAAGFDLYLTKPAEPEELVNRLRALVGRASGELNSA